MIAAIARQLSYELDLSLAKGGTEPQIVSRFVNSARGIAHGGRFNIESIFVHQKPYAYLENPTSICGKSKCELGDILLIIKRIRAGRVIDHRFVFLQAKIMKRDVGSVEVHQFRFYRDIGVIDFRFGNSVFATAKAQPLIWSDLTRSAWFGSYLFLDHHRSTCARTSLIDTQYPGGCDAFSFVPPSYWPWCQVSSAYTGFFTFELFLISFFQLRGIGCGVNARTAGFLDIILKRFGWILDPPEETEGFFEEDPKGGFGVLRVTIKDDDNS